MGFRPIETIDPDPDEPVWRPDLDFPDPSEDLCPVCQSPDGLMVHWFGPKVTDGWEWVACACKAGQANLAQMREAARAAAGLDASMAAQTLDSFLPLYQPEAIADARRFVDQPRPLLVFFGKTGTGKSHLLAGIANGLIDRSGPRPRYASAPRLVSALQRSVGGHQRDETNALWDDLLDAEVLLLDELGAESQGDYAQQQVFSLIDYRYANLRPTVIATNVKMSDLPPRFVSRASDHSRSRVVIMRNTDFRVNSESPDPWN